MSRKLEFAILHVFAVEGRSEFLQTILNNVINYDVYDEVDEILVRIKYTNKKALEEFSNILNRYDKINIIHVGHYSHKNYSKYIKKYFKPELQTTKITNPSIDTLGEIETFLEFILNPEYRKYLNKYETGAFFHTKSISISSEYNTRITDKQENEVQSSILQNILNELQTNDSYVFDNNSFFTFWTGHWKSFNMDNYLKLHYYTHLADKRKMKWPAYHPNVLKIDDNYYMKNRHAFAEFNRKLSFFESCNYTDDDSLNKTVDDMKNGVEVNIW